ncbi:helix-turn-helix transcriptional regulator [Thalassospira sp.]|uniref:helix-turn-helix transcriptional regulator n=1 Tax=Thalassospira sp. TaxID=1912094 RepID=UPI0032EE8688
MTNLENETGYDGGFILSLGELIRRTREKRGMSRTGLAKMTGISPNSMVKYEMAGQPQGKYPSLLNAAKISMALSIDPRWMFEMLFRAGEIKADSDFASLTFNSFVWHFKDMEMEGKIAHVTSNGALADHYFEQMFEKLENLEKEVAKLTQELEKKNGPDR